MFKKILRESEKLTKKEFSFDAAKFEQELKFECPKIGKFNPLVKEFKNPNPNNALRLHIGSDLWLEIMAILPAKTVVMMIYSCKFFAEKTTDANIQLKIALAKPHLGIINFKELARLSNNNDAKVHSLLRSNSFVCNRHLQRVTAELAEEKLEVVADQPGEFGFVMYK